VISTRTLADALPDGETVLARHALHLEPAPRLVRTAREFVREHAPPLPPETIEVVLLLTSELVTNAVIHARTAVEVGVVVSERSVVVAVHDLDLRRPEQQPYADREGGWGLALVTALAQQSAVEQHADGGKTAWFRVARGDSPAIADSAASRGQGPWEARA
jgi:two-component sensor histidine kinase